MITSDKLERAKSEIKQSINSITFGVILGFVSTLSGIYRSFSKGASLQLTGLAFSFIAVVLLLFVPVMLKKESKHALTLVLLGFGFGWAQWFFSEEAFGFNFVSIILLLVFGWFITRFLKWVRNVGALR